MGDLPYITSEQGGRLIIRIWLIYEFTMYKRPIPIRELQGEEGGGLIIHHGPIIRTVRYPDSLCGFTNCTSFFNSNLAYSLPPRARYSNVLTTTLC